MKTSQSLYVSLLGLAMFFTSACVRAEPSTTDEAALGAAAIVVLAQKCRPEHVAHYDKEALAHLSYMLQRYSAPARNKIIEEFRMKIKALRISSSKDTCASAERLHSMAVHWGYQHIFQTMMSGQ